MFFHFVIQKCLLFTKTAWTRILFSSHVRPICVSSLKNSKLPLSTKTALARIRFLHMFGYFMFLHLAIRKCLLTTKTALARIRFSSHVRLLCVSSFRNSKLPFKHKNCIGSNPFFFTCSATLCFFT